MRFTDYDAVVLSVSGGKDSQCMMPVVMAAVARQAPACVIYADTGAEDYATLGHVGYLCRAYRVPLHVAVPFRALPDHIEARCRKMQAAGRKGGWPSSASRYCTSDCKRSPIHVTIRRLFPEGRILMCTGERRQESPHRAKLLELEPVKLLCTRKRTVDNWRPILKYKVEDVWAGIAGSGLAAHPAYAEGNERLSCAMCILATEGDIRNGARRNPELAARYLRIEREYGHTFRAKKALAEILNKEKEDDNGRDMR